jgi:antitoxin YefM
MSLDDYNSWQETKYLLSSPNNHQRLERAIKATEQGIFETHDLIEE